MKNFLADTVLWNLGTTKPTYVGYSHILQLHTYEYITSKYIHSNHSELYNSYFFFSLIFVPTYTCTSKYEQLRCNNYSVPYNSPLFSSSSTYCIKITILILYIRYSRTTKSYIKNFSADKKKKIQHSRDCSFLVVSYGHEYIRNLRHGGYLQNLTLYFVVLRIRAPFTRLLRCLKAFLILSALGLCTAQETPVKRKCLISSRLLRVFTVYGSFPKTFSTKCRIFSAWHAISRKE